MTPARTRKDERNGRKDVSRHEKNGAINGTIHILVVDDDPEILQALETYFQMEGCRVTSATNGADALSALKNEHAFDLVLLDVVLPEMNGFEVLRRSQEMGTNSPVLMMSGRGDQEDILKGFGLGAQDYIVKPFDAEELVMRTKILLGQRNATAEPLEFYEIGDLEINFTSERAVRRDNQVEFSEMELDLLRCLIKNRGYVVTKKRLLKEAWRIDDDLIAHTINPDIATEKIDQSVSSIRSKVEPDPSKPRFIETVYGLGYRFTG